MPIMMSEEEKKFYESELDKEREIQKVIRDKERKEKIINMAKRKAKPLKEKAKKVLDYLSRIRVGGIK